MTQEVKLRRVKCNYQLENSRFLLECDFSKQYANYYRRRLERTKPFLVINCQARWGVEIPIYSLDELAALPSQTIDADFDSPKSSSTISPPDPDPNIIGSYGNPKRFRRSSDSSKSLTPEVQQHDVRSPKTSTQKDGINSVPSKLVGRESDCIVIGTIFKRMKLQPDVVRELSSGNFHIKHERYHGHFTSQDDTLVLEDADESISLVGNINPKQFVTGVVVALLGVPIDEGSQFMVHDTCFAEPNRHILYSLDVLSQPTINEIERPLAVEPIYLLVLSGLGFHHEMDKRSALTRALQDLIDFIWGGTKFSDDERSSRVARILVAGDCLSDDRFAVQEGAIVDSKEDDIASEMKKSRQVKPYEESIQAVKYMDDFFAQLSKTINVDLMPGASDPTSHLLPQQPFHPCMFPKSCMYSTFNCTTNPYHAVYDDNVELMATSGQNIDIINKFSGMTDPIEIMKCHLKWGNCAPSAPDNLYSVPYEDEDPFIIDFIPEIYLAGCQSSFKTDYYYYDSADDATRCNNVNDTNKTGTSRGTTLETLALKIAEEKSNQIPSSSAQGSNIRGNGSSKFSLNGKTRTKLVTVPRFCETFSCVLIDLKNLDSQLLTF